MRSWMSVGGGDIKGEEGGCGEGGGRAGGWLVTLTSTCGMDLSTLFWNRHSVCVPRGNETVIERSVETMSAVPSA